MLTPLGLTKSFKWRLFPALIAVGLIGLYSFYVITSSLDVDMTAWYLRSVYNASIVTSNDAPRNTNLNGNVSLNVFVTNTPVLKIIKNNDTVPVSHATPTTDNNAETVTTTLNCSDVNSTLCVTAAWFDSHNPSPTTATAHRVSTVDNVLQYLYITTSFRGRLGNQMCMYAALLGIAKANDRRPFIRSGTLLDGNFAITHVTNNISTHGWTTVHQENHAQFYPSFFNLPKRNITLWGYFFSWKFLDHAKEEIRREFTFHPGIQQRRDEFFRQLTKQRGGDVVSVGVHVRRGDFLAERHQDAGFGVPQASYYVKAFATLRELLPNGSLVFVVASDDLGWCESNLNASDVVILSQGSPGLHLAILAGCDHSVISGGTYGWWAAWLANGTTVYYADYPTPGSQLSRGFVNSDVYLPSWIPRNN
ncbi:unnamed protein product [Lymnaea stagnalis]|uniref:L-Fucosyltransferase n=1 Tax=Lymnaea stagnalis TaxID=6523 RepID=A0AAV2HQK9_LYMST